MLATGMNPFINAQGRPKIGMMTTVIGAVLNLALDPLFIYGFHMGVTGAAVATVISQAVSCIWVLRLRPEVDLCCAQRREARIIRICFGDILSLGVVGFIMKSPTLWVGQIVSQQDGRTTCMADSMSA